MSPIPFCFLLCSERSGSNLITRLMDAHDDISAPPPSHLFRLFASNEANYGNLQRDENWEILIQDMVQAFDDQLGVWRTRPDVNDLKQRARGRRTVADLLRLIYVAEAQRHGASLIFVKENHAARFADFLQRHFDPCRFVFLVRDPRDVAASYMSTSGIPGGVARATEVWLDDQRQNLMLKKKRTAEIHFLRYEDLIAQTRQELMRITSFLGLEFQSQMLSYHRDHQVRRNATRVEAWKNLAKPVLKSNAGKFEEVLTREEIEYVELQCLELMAEFGYRPRHVEELPEAGRRATRVAELAGRLRDGDYRLASDEEMATRERRLKVISDVLSRRLP